MADENTNTQTLGAALTPTDPLIGRATEALGAYEQTPQGQRSQSQYQTDIEQQREGYTAEKKAMEAQQPVLQEQVQAAKRYQQQLQNVPDIGTQASYFRQNTPLLMLMTAVGGIYGRGGSIAALQAMNGMLEGQLQGDQFKYDAAKQAHDDAISKITNEFNAASMVNDAVLKATQGQVDSARLGREAAAAAIGVDEKMLAKGETNFLNIYGKLVQQQTAAEKAERDARYRQQALAIRRDTNERNARIKLDDKYAKVKQADIDNQTGLARLEGLLNEWNALKSSLADKGVVLSDYAPLAESTIDKINTVKSEDYARLQQGMADAAGFSLSLQNAGLSTGAQRIRAVEVRELEGLPNLKGKTPAMITRALTDLITKVKQQQEDIEYAMQFWESERTGMGFTPFPGGGGKGGPKTPADTLSEADRILAGGS